MPRMGCKSARSIAAALAAIACGLARRRQRAALILSAGLQAGAAVVGAIFLIAAPDAPAVGIAYLIVGGILFWAFTTGGRERSTLRS